MKNHFASEPLSDSDFQQRPISAWPDQHHYAVTQVNADRVAVGVEDVVVIDVVSAC